MLQPLVHTLTYCVSRWLNRWYFSWGTRCVRCEVCAHSCSWTSRVDELELRILKVNFTAFGSLSLSSHLRPPLPSGLIPDKASRFTLHQLTARTPYLDKLFTVRATHDDSSATKTKHFRICRTATLHPSGHWGHQEEFAYAADKWGSCPINFRVYERE
jgi:hypothetical protein